MILSLSISTRELLKSEYFQWHDITDIMCDAEQILFSYTDDRLSRGSNSSLSSCSSMTSEQRTSFFIGQEIAEDSELASSSFTM